MTDPKPKAPFVQPTSIEGPVPDEALSGVAAGGCPPEIKWGDDTPALSGGGKFPHNVPRPLLE